jgi:hypothetical protein
MYDAHERDSVLLRVQRLPLSLLMKGEFLNTDFWAPDLDFLMFGAENNE